VDKTRATYVGDNLADTKGYISNKVGMEVNPHVNSRSLITSPIGLKTLRIHHRYYDLQTIETNVVSFVYGYCITFICV